MRAAHVSRLALPILLVVCPLVSHAGLNTDRPFLSWQGIISYLESKLERLQDRDNQPSLGAGAVAAAVVEHTDVASTGAAPVAGRDEAVLVSDSSSRSSLTVGDWAAAAAELEAQELPYTAAVAAGGEEGSVRGSGSDGGSEYGEGLGQGLGAAAPSVWRSNGKAQAGKARVRVAAFAAHTYEQPAVVAVAAAAADLEAVQEDALASDGGDSALIVPLAVTPAAAVAEEATPARRPSRPGAETRYAGRRPVRCPAGAANAGVRSPVCGWGGPSWRLRCLLISFTWPFSALPSQPRAASNRRAQRRAPHCARVAAGSATRSLACAPSCGRGTRTPLAWCRRRRHSSTPAPSHTPAPSRARCLLPFARRDLGRHCSRCQIESNAIRFLLPGTALCLLSGIPAVTLDCQHL